MSIVTTHSTQCRLIFTLVFLFQAATHAEAGDVSVGEGELGGPPRGHRPQAGGQAEALVPDVQGPSLGTVSCWCPRFM